MGTKLVHPVPEHLSDYSKSLWQSLVPRRCRSAGRVALLKVALEQIDRREQIRETLRTEGLTVKTERSGVTHVHPLLKAESEATRLINSIFATLGIEFDGEIDGRVWPDEGTI